MLTWTLEQQDTKVAEDKDRQADGQFIVTR
jgi:hypothetical protein